MFRLAMGVLYVEYPHRDMYLHYDNRRQQLESRTGEKGKTTVYFHSGIIYLVENCYPYSPWDDVHKYWTGKQRSWQRQVHVHTIFGNSTQLLVENVPKYFTVSISFSNPQE